ncbi:MAG TPA: YsnF/AvaK domain-containing protein [Urbifossiella sp.]|jgi:uncharacterized protein (TIGR02271 family)|nr:YsnF/AvaK domain-containing protein [Urbifossiella sp.]
MPHRKKKHNTVVGVFESQARADQAVADLKAAGFSDSEIGMVHRDAEGKTVKTGAADETNAEEGAAIGAAAGAGALALGSLAVSFAVIPVVGPVLAVGPLAAALISAAGGAVAGGLVGALIGWGVPEEDAAFYEGEVKAGRYLVTAEAGDKTVEAQAILSRRGGFDRAAWTAVRADRANTLADGGLTAEDGRVIRLHEEHLTAHKQPVETGDVRVRKEVRTEHRQIAVPVEREEVVIERRPVSRAAGAGEIKAEEIRIPVREERVTVTKEPVVTEEVRVGKRKVHDTETVSGDVRKEELTVEPKGGARVRNTGGHK